MNRILWFTHTNIVSVNWENLEFDLTKYLDIFLEQEIWKKKINRTEYKKIFGKADLEKISSIKIKIHQKDAPYSNFHKYENLINEYIDITVIDKNKLASSGIDEANKIAVIQVEFNSEYPLIPHLNYEQEKDVDLVMAKLKNLDSWVELSIIKTIVYEFLDFFIFSLHLNFLTHSYSFSFTEKPILSGLIVVSDNTDHYFEVDKLEKLSHYILYEKEDDILFALMNDVSKWWCKDIPTVIFFLDALKSNYITSTSFIKLCFTLESFFDNNISNDYISLVVPLILADNILEMKECRLTIRNSFKYRNQIVHGNKLLENEELEELFFQLKNLIIKLFHFSINNKLYLRKDGYRIRHELIFELMSKGSIKKIDSM